MFPAKIGLTLLLLGLSFPVLPEATERLVELVNEATAAIVGSGVDEREWRRGEDREADSQEEEGARKEGQVPRTQELGAWAALLVVGHGPAGADRPRDRRRCATLMAQAPSPWPKSADRRAGAGSCCGDGLDPRPRRAGRCSAAGMMVVGVAGALAQGGFCVATKLSSRSLPAEPDHGHQADLRPAGALGGRQDAASRRVLARLLLLRDQGHAAAARRPGPIPVALSMIADDAPQPDPRRRRGRPRDGRRRLRRSSAASTSRRG